LSLPLSIIWFVFTIIYQVYYTASLIVDIFAVFPSLPPFLNTFLVQVRIITLFASLILTIICGSFDTVLSILKNHILRQSLGYIMIDDHVKMFRSARRWYFFAIINSVLMLSSGTIAAICSLIPSLKFTVYYFIGLLYLVEIIFMIFMIIGIIYYGIYVFKLGEDYDSGVLKAAGIIIIILDVLGLPQVGFLLLYIGLRNAEYMAPR